MKRKGFVSLVALCATVGVFFTYGPEASRKLYILGRVSKTQTLNGTEYVLGRVSKTQTLNGAEKKILFYTTFYGNEFSPSSSPESCDYNCDWTTDRSYFNKSDGVIFSIRNNLKEKDFVIEELPARRDVDQVWAFFIIEPQGFFYPNQLKLLKDKFNISITFQSDSDISVPLGVARKLSPQEIEARSRTNMDYSKGKHKLVSWMVSNCVTGSRREVYVAELKKYIEVDIYGKCGNETNQPGTDNEYRQFLASQYKFYLAFENSDCDDYITEKFWVNLEYGMIPVVRGHRTSYRKHAPPNSYINADWFGSAKELADYLKEVASNHTLFNSYHRWRTFYEVNHAAFSVNSMWVCEFCKKLYEMSPQSIDVYEHFSEDTRCFTQLESSGVRNRTGERIQDLQKGPMLPNRN